MCVMAQLQLRFISLAATVQGRYSWLVGAFPTHDLVIQRWRILSSVVLLALSPYLSASYWTKGKDSVRDKTPS